MTMTQNALNEEEARAWCDQLVNSTREFGVKTFGVTFWDLHPHLFFVTRYDSPGNIVEVTFQPKHALDLLLVRGKSEYARTVSYALDSTTLPQEILNTFVADTERMGSVLLATQVLAFFRSSGIGGAAELGKDLQQEYKEFDREKMIPHALADGTPNPARFNYAIARIRRFMQSGTASCPHCKTSSVWHSHDGGWSCKGCHAVWFTLPLTNGWRLPKPE